MTPKTSTKTIVDGQELKTVAPETHASLYAALVAAQAELQNPTKDSKATVKSEKGSYQYGYVSFASVLDTVRPILAAHGLCIVQRTFLAGEIIMLETNLVHESGEMIDTVLPVARMGGAPQALGSALSYMRRYSVLAILSLAAEDDDAKSAQEAYRPEPRREPPRPASAPSAPSAPSAQKSLLDPAETDWDAKAREWIAEIDACETVDDLHAFAQRRGPDLRLMSEHDRNGYTFTQAAWRRRLEEVKRAAPPAPALSREAARAEQALLPGRDGTYSAVLDDEVPYAPEVR